MRRWHALGSCTGNMYLNPSNLRIPVIDLALARVDRKVAPKEDGRGSQMDLAGRDDLGWETWPWMGEMTLTGRDELGWESSTWHAGGRHIDLANSLGVASSLDNTTIHSTVTSSTLIFNHLHPSNLHPQSPTTTPSTHIQSHLRHWLVKRADVCVCVCVRHITLTSISQPCDDMPSSDHVDTVQVNVTTSVGVDTQESGWSGECWDGDGCDVVNM